MYLAHIDYEKALDSCEKVEPEAADHKNVLQSAAEEGFETISRVLPPTGEMQTSPMGEIDGKRDFKMGEAYSGRTVEEKEGEPTIEGFLMVWGEEAERAEVQERAEDKEADNFLLG